MSEFWHGTRHRRCPLGRLLAIAYPAAPPICPLAKSSPRVRGVAGSSRPAVGWRVRKGLLSARPLSRAPIAVGVAGSEPASVDVDLVVDDLEVSCISASLAVTSARRASRRASRSCLLPGPPTPLPALLGVYLLFGIGLGTTNRPITTSAVSGMPVSMARGGRSGRIHQPPGRDYPGGGRVRVSRRRGDGSRRSGLHRSDPYRLVDRGRPRAGDLRTGTDWLQA